MNEEKNAEEIQETVQAGWSFSPRLCCFIRGGVKIDKTYLLIYGDSSIFGSDLFICSSHASLNPTSMGRRMRKPQLSRRKTGQDATLNSSFQDKVHQWSVIAATSNRHRHVCLWRRQQEVAPGFKMVEEGGGGSRAGEGARSGLCSGQLWPDQSKKTDKNPEKPLEKKKK